MSNEQFDKQSKVLRDQLVEKVCFFKKVLVLNPYPQTPFPRWKAVYAWLALHRAKPLCIHARHPCRGWVWGCRPIKQGRLKSVAHSRYARKHKDSHTKPLHDATAQMAVIAQMQRHKWLSMHRRNDTNGWRPVLGLRPSTPIGFNSVLNIQN